MLKKEIQEIKVKLKNSGYETSKADNFMYRVGFKTGYKIALQHQKKKTKLHSWDHERTASRKKLKAISEAVTDGILIHYYAEPNSVSSITDSIDIDNTLHNAVVDYVKKCLYMDKAGASGSSLYLTDDSKTTDPSAAPFG